MKLGFWGLTYFKAMGNANAPEAIKTFTSSGYTVTRAPYDSASFSGIGKTLSHTQKC